MSSEPASKPVEQVAVFDPSVKKKKKKPVVKSAPSAAPAAPVEATTAASPPPTKETPPLVEAPKSVDTTTPTQPAPAVTTPATTEQQPMPAQATPSPITTTAATESWLDSDRDYTYEELCRRIFDMLQKNNPEFANRQKRFVMKPPQICKEGTKKTVWINFAEICTMYIDVLDFCLLYNSMHRKTDHVLAYVFAELGTHGSLDGSQRLVIRGRYQPKQIENIIRKYIS